MLEAATAVARSELVGTVVEGLNVEPEVRGFQVGD